MGSASGLGGLGGLFSSNNPIGQIFLYQVIGGLVAPMLAPYVQELANISNHHDPQVPLTPDQLAMLVIRGYIDIPKATDIAMKSGMDADTFYLLQNGTGNAPAPAELAEALRRGFIPEDSPDPDQLSFLGGIRQGDLKDKWAPLVKKLSTAIPSPSDFLDALLEGQTDEATARALYLKAGGDPDYFTLMFNTRGSAPTPLEAANMAFRGVIPWDGTGPDVVSFQQAFLEGPWRNKWLEPYRAVAQYIPPPRTVTAMLREGSFTQEQALALFEKAGLTPELAAAYVTSATSQKTQPHRELALGVVQTLYEDMAITADAAKPLIESLGYDSTEADFLLEVSDLKRAQASINRALTTTHTLYVGHKITRTTASGEIDSLGVASQMRDELLTIWDGERSEKVALLTPTQVRSALKKGLLDEAGATDRLTAYGYGADDAAIFLQL